MKKFIILILIVAAITGCKRNDVAMEEAVAATFQSALLEDSGNYVWAENDKIGVYMVITTSASLSVPIRGYEALNVPYESMQSDLTSTLFSAADSVIYYPVDGTVVDFYAYYPHSISVVEDGVYSVDVSTQNEREIAVRTAAVRAKSSHNANVEFSFANRLTKLTLSLLPSQEVSDLTGLEATLVGHYTKAKVNIRNGEVYDQNSITDIGLKVSVEGTTVSGVLIPTQSISGSYIEFNVGGKQYVWSMSTIDLESGKEITLQIRVESAPVVIGDIQITPWGEGSGGDIEANEVVN